MDSLWCIVMYVFTVVCAYCKVWGGLCDMGLIPIVPVKQVQSWRYRSHLLPLHDISHLSNRNICCVHFSLFLFITVGTLNTVKIYLFCFCLALHSEEKSSAYNWQSTFAKRPPEYVSVFLCSVRRRRSPTVFCWTICHVSRNVHKLVARLKKSLCWAKWTLLKQLATVKSIQASSLLFASVIADTRKAKVRIPINSEEQCRLASGASKGSRHEIMSMFGVLSLPSIRFLCQGLLLPVFISTCPGYLPVIWNSNEIHVN